MARAFCWTRIGHEAGQDIAAILQRKELERRLNCGAFAWGVGHSLGRAMQQLVECEKKPLVAFSPIRGDAAQHDRVASQILIWTRYIDPSGEQRTLPAGMLVTSRAQTPAGQPKRAHYALFCRSDLMLSADMQDELDLGELFNLATGRRVGFSQVTAIVMRRRGTVTAMRYRVSFAAELIAPHAARLVAPAAFRSEDLADVEFAAHLGDIDTYEKAVLDLRARADAATNVPS